MTEEKLLNVIYIFKQNKNDFVVECTMGVRRLHQISSLCDLAIISSGYLFE